MRVNKSRYIPVWHSDDDAFDAQLTGTVDDRLHGRYQHFAAFQTKSFLRHPLSRQKFFKPEQRRNILRNNITVHWNPTG